MNPPLHKINFVDDRLEREARQKKYDLIESGDEEDSKGKKKRKSKKDKKKKKKKKRKKRDSSSSSSSSSRFENRSHFTKRSFFIGNLVINDIVIYLRPVSVRAQTKKKVRKRAKGDRRVRKTRVPGEERTEV